MTKLNPTQIPAILLGYAQLTAGASTGSQSASGIGLGVTVTIPTLPTGRMVKVTAAASNLYYSTGSGGYIGWTVWDGAVGSGTQIARCQTNGGSSGNAFQAPAMAIAYYTPSAGSHTYNVGLSISQAGNAAAFEANPGFPAFISVEIV